MVGFLVRHCESITNSLQPCTLPGQASTLQPSTTGHYMACCMRKMHSCMCVISTGNGQLERGELGALVRDFLGAGKVTNADVSYFLVGCTAGSTACVARVGTRPASVPRLPAATTRTLATLAGPQ